MTPGFSSEFASKRTWAFETTHPLRTYLPVLQSWNRSAEVLNHLRELISSLPILDSIETIAVSGSLGRMEFLPESDVDLIIVAKDNLYAHHDSLMALSETIWNSVREAGYCTSKPDGIFARPVTTLELCDPATIGKLDEQPALFGKRIQLLLDSQPICNDDNFKRLQSRILTRYELPPEENNPDQAAYLVNDLLRYQRALAMRYQFQLKDIPLQWRLLNAKFRHSRFINHFGLLLLLGEMTRQPVAKAEWLRKALNWTPLERIAAVYLRHHDPLFHILQRGYSQFLLWMSDESFRNELATGSVPEENEAYQEIHRNGRIMTRELTRFLHERHHDWNEDFMNRLTY